MKDTFYSSKRYIGKYIPIYTFEAYGDTVNYFIKLQYLCNRDDYQNIRTPRGSELNFDMQNVDGYAIFGDIASEHLEVLKNRNYTLEAEEIPEEDSDDDRLVCVSEIYVYEPNSTWSKYNSEIVPMWGIQDDSQAATTSVVFGTGNVYTNSSLNSELVFASTEDFKTGDVVLLTWDAYWWYEIERVEGSGDSEWLNQVCTLTPTSLMEIYSINGNIVEFTTALSNPGTAPDLPQADGETYIGDWLVQSVGQGIQSEFFYRGDLTNLQILNKSMMFAKSCIVEKIYANRAYNKRLSLVRETISYHKDVPEIPARFAPSNEVGTESTIISRATTTSPSDWKSKVVNEEWFIYTEPELAFDKTLGLYRLKIKETKCV